MNGTLWVTPGYTNQSLLTHTHLRTRHVSTLLVANTSRQSAGSCNNDLVLQQEAVALLEARTSEDGRSEENISALHSQDEEHATQQHDQDSEIAARALLGAPDTQTGKPP